MARREYRPKEIQIIQAFLRKMGEGCKLASLRVQEIATEAGVGKGTIYEYFSSKEEIVEESVFYCLDQELEQMKQYIDTALDFDVLLDQLFSYLMDAATHHSLVYDLLIHNQGWEIMEFIAKEHLDIVKQYISEFSDLMKIVIDRGKTEKYIDERWNEDFCQFVFKAAFDGVASIWLMESKKTSKDLAKQMIERSIGTPVWGESQCEAELN